MQTRILITTASYGEGHNAAAKALETAFNDESPGTARVVDIFALCTPRLNSFIRSTYLSAINRTPGLWKYAYAWMDRPSFMTRSVALLRPQWAMLRGIIEREKPVAICSTFPAYAAIFQHFGPKAGFDVPHFNIVTDSISINSIWWRPGCNGWFVPNEDSAEVMRAAGVDPARIHVTGFPVPPFFRKNEGDRDAPALSEGAAPRVLYIINSGTQERRGDGAAAARRGGMGGHLHRGPGRVPAQDR